jgi:hypothetical protein
MDHEEYLRRVKQYIKTPTDDMKQQLDDFCSLCSYISGQYDQDESFVNLEKHLQELEAGRKETNRIFYMALPPSVFITVSQHLKKNCYPKSGIARVIVSGGQIILFLTGTDGPLPGREALRKGSPVLKRASTCTCARLERGGDFPHRPLSGKRDGEEYSDFTVWKRVLRCYLESQPHR